MEVVVVEVFEVPLGVDSVEGEEAVAVDLAEAVTTLVPQSMSKVCLVVERCFHLHMKRWECFCNRARVTLCASLQTRRSPTLTLLFFWKTSNKLEKWMTFLGQ